MKYRLFTLSALCSLAVLLCAGSALACGSDGATTDSTAQPEGATAPAADGDKPAPKAPEKPQPKEVVFTTLQVDGVTCGSCLIPIRRELNALKGVKEIESGVDIKEVIVSYLPGSVSPQQLVDAVKKAGYEAIVKGAGPPPKT